MTRDETTALLGIMKTAYPTFYRNITKDEAEQTIDLWCQMFKDDNCLIVTEAVKALIYILRYPPTIADVKEKMRLITQPEQITEMEAWGQVRCAISYYNAKDNFDGLSPILKKLVGSANQLREWALMDAEHLETVVKSNFMRSYTARVKADQQIDCLPNSTKELITGLTHLLGDGGVKSA